MRISRDLVERPLEERSPELRNENVPDLCIKESEGGLVGLAERLGIRGGQGVGGT